MTNLKVNTFCNNYHHETYHSHQAELCRGRSRKKGLKETLETVFYREYDDDEDCDCDFDDDDYDGDDEDCDDDVTIRGV